MISDAIRDQSISNWADPNTMEAVAMSNIYNPADSHFVANELRSSISPKSKQLVT